MNVLLLDSQHCFVNFALRLMKSGHHVKVCMAIDKETKQRVKTGDGLVEKIEREEWEPQASWADLILLSDNDKWLRELDRKKKQGYPILAPSYESAQIELDRKKGQAFFKAHSIPTVPYQSFSDAKKAEKYVLQKMERLVCKPNNNQARELSYCSDTPADMVFMLRYWEKLRSVKGEFLLQDFVDGIEFGVSGWLGPEGFCGYFEEFFEFKKLLADDLGPMTGEQGTALKYVSRSESNMAKELLLPLEGDLIKMGHTGSVAVGAIIKEEGTPIPLEGTLRLGWPSFQIVQLLHPEPCEWMARLVDGEDDFHPLDDHAVGVVVTQPPYPLDDFIRKCGGVVKKQTEGIPLYGLDDENEYRDNIAPSDVMSGVEPSMVDGVVADQRMLVSTGDYLAVCTGVGDSVRSAKDQAYNVVDSLHFINSPGYRPDIGDRVKRDIPKLQEVGFATSWTW